MTRKTFWIINQTAGSPHHGMVYRNYYVAREWVKQGHRAVIISGSFFHNFHTLPKTTGLFTHEVIDGIDYWWVRMPRYSQSRSFGRLFSIFLFPLLLLFFPFWRLPKPETVIVSGPPHVPILNAWFWSRWFGATLVYEVRDIWPLTIVKLGRVSPHHPVIMLLSLLERLAYMLSDRVVSVLALAWRHFQSRGMAAGKFAYLPNGVSVDDSPVVASDTADKMAELARGKFVVVYAGSLGIANNLDQLLQAAGLLKTDPRFHFVLVGDGPHRAKLEAAARSLGNVSMFPPVSKREIPAILSRAHVGYVGLMKTDLFRHGVSPNKLFDYMAASLPVLMAIDTEDDIVGNAGCGETVASCEPKDIAAALTRLADLPETELRGRGAAGRNYLERHHTYPSLAADYVRIAEEGRRPGEVEPRWVVSPFWLGFWGVMALGSLVHFLFPALWPHLFTDGITNFLSDPHDYHRQALALAQGSWADFTLFPGGNFPGGAMGLTYKLTGIHRPWVFLPVLGALAGLTIRALASCLDVLGVRGRWWPWILGLFMTVTPTSFSWMVYPHKDAFLVPGCCVLLWTLLAVTFRRIRIRHVLSLGLGCFLVFSNKSYFAELLLAGSVLALPFVWKHPATILGRWGRMAFWAVVLGVFAAVALEAPKYSDDGMASRKATPAVTQATTPRHEKTAAEWKGLPGWGFLDRAFKPLVYTRERFLSQRSGGATNFLPDIHLEGTLDALVFVPRALQLALLEPVPWRSNGNQGGAKGLLFLLVKLEMLLVYALLLALLWNPTALVRPHVAICLAIALPFLLALGFAAPNIGAINRYRFPFLLMVKLAGFSALWAADRRRWPGRLLMWVDPPADVRPRRRLLFLVPDDATFIIQRLVMAQAAQRAGYDVHVACPDFGHAAKIRELGFTHHEVDLNRGGLNPFADAAAFVRLVFFLARLRPDLLHNVSIKPVIYGSTAGTVVGLPRIVNLVNGLGYAFERRGLKGEVVHAVAVSLYRNALALPGVRVIFQNPDDRAYFVDHHMVEEHKTVMIRGSGVDMQKFAPTPMPENPVPVVLFVGRLLWSKGLQHLVDAGKKLREEGLDFRLVMVGEPDERNPEAVSPEVLKKWNAKGWVEWVGRQSDMPKFYRAADIVCLPTVYREGLPLTLLEAASIGRPLVSTDIPGCREVVRNGMNGILVRPADVDDLASALRTLLTNPQLRQRYGEASSAMVAAEFSSEHVGRQLTELYESLFDDALQR